MPETSLRVAVLQPGARLHYAVPTLLHRAGVLQRLYTDFANTGIVGHLDHLWPRSCQPRPVRRLLGRRIPAELPHSKIRQVRGAVMREQLAHFVGRTTKTAPSSALMQLARRERFGDANTIYTVLVNEDLELCQEASGRGCRIVHEAMLSPSIGLVKHNEECGMLNHERPEALEKIIRGRERDSRKYSVADLILVPSEFVRNDILELGADPEKVRVVPYGIDKSWLSLAVAPVKGRVLFVGKVGLIKGSHYLAEAARILARRHVNCEVRVVGPREPRVLEKSVFHGPHYIGQVPRAEIQREYAAADIFVLPSLSESFGLVTLEAMAAGLPIIATPCAGTCVRDGVDGIIVPPRDAAAIAFAIELIVGDRALREMMSRNARERAAEFTWDRYGSRLLDALSSLSPGVCSTHPWQVTGP